MHFRFNLNNFLEDTRWYKIQAHFSQCFGLPISTLNSKGEFTNGKNGSLSLCDEVLKLSSVSSVICKNCIPDSLESLEHGWKDGVKCPLGFYNFFIPVKAMDLTIAYILVGPLILGSRPLREDLFERALGLNVNINSFVQAVDELKAFTFYGIKSMIEFIHDIVSYIIDIEYQNIELKSSFQESCDANKEKINPYTQKLLNALFEVSTEFIGADRSSLMIYDKKNNYLSIAQAIGIDKRIVKNTQLKLGEGIAGLVAQNKKPMLINSVDFDLKLRNRLINENIESALSVPIIIKNNLIGVINIAIYGKVGKKITLKNIEDIENLIRLVEAAS